MEFLGSKSTLNIPNDFDIVSEWRLGQGFYENWRCINFQCIKFHLYYFNILILIFRFRK